MKEIFPNKFFFSKSHYNLILCHTRLCNSLDTVLNEAERNHRSGDEEQEYIFYMKYFNLVDVIKKHRDFNKKLSNTIAKGGDIKHRMDILEKLHANLLRR